MTPSLADLDMANELAHIAARATLTARDAATIRAAAAILRGRQPQTPAEARSNRVSAAMAAANLTDPDDVIEMIRRLAEKIGATTDTTAKIAEILDMETP